MSRPRNPNPGLFIDGRDLIYRDYSLTEQQDYTINIKRYIAEGYVVATVGNHFNGAFVVTGWKISQDIYGAK